jgi:hypothetical protein
MLLSNPQQIVDKIINKSPKFKWKLLKLFWILLSNDKEIDVIPIMVIIIPRYPILVSFSLINIKAIMTVNSNSPLPIPKHQRQ